MKSSLLTRKHDFYKGRWDLLFGWNVKKTVWDSKPEIIESIILKF